MSVPYPTLQELQSQILVAPVTDLEPHVQKGICLKIDDSLSLAETALLITTDQKEKVAELIDKQKLQKTSIENYQAWKKDKVFFEFIIVQPFVLIKTLVKLNSAPSQT